MAAGCVKGRRTSPNLWNTARSLPTLSVPPAKSQSPSDDVTAMFDTTRTKPDSFDARYRSETHSHSQAARGVAAPPVAFVDLLCGQEPRKPPRRGLY